MPHFRTGLRAIALGVALITSSMTTAGALEFSKHPADSDDVNAVLVKGRIEAQDVLRFIAHVDRLPKKKRTDIYLESPGGSIQTAMALGREIYKSKFRTYAINPASGSSCSSACTLVLIAGRDKETEKPYRVKGSTTRVGFHNFYPVLPEKAYTAKDVLATEARAQKVILDIANYLIEVEADLTFLKYSLRQKEVYPIKNEEALSIGINVLEDQSKEMLWAETYRARIGK